MAWSTGVTHGKKARVLAYTTVGDTAIDWSSDWSISVTQDAAVFQRQGQQYKEALPGQSAWTGSANFMFVPGSSEQRTLIDRILTTNATVITTALTTQIKFCDGSTLNYLRGDMVITGLNITAGVGDIMKCSFTFQGSGILTMTTP